MTVNDQIVKMVLCIPSTEFDLLAELQKNYDDNEFENIESSVQLANLRRVIKKFIPNPNKQWEFDVAHIFNL